MYNTEWTICTDRLGGKRRDLLEENRGIHSEETSQINWEEFGGRIVRKPHRESSTGIQGEGITVNKG